MMCGGCWRGCRNVSGDISISDFEICSRGVFDGLGVSELKVGHERHLLVSKNKLQQA